MRTKRDFCDFMQTNQVAEWKNGTDCIMMDNSDQDEWMNMCSTIEQFIEFDLWNIFSW
jgi:hypothetical protein